MHLSSSRTFPHAATTRLAPKTRSSDFPLFVRHSSFDLRHSAFRFALAFLLIFSYQFARYSAQASTGKRAAHRPSHSKPARPSPWGRYKKLTRDRSVDGINYLQFDSTSPQDQKKQPSPAGDNFPDSTPDLFEFTDGLADVTADTRNDQDVAHLSVSDLSAVILRTPLAADLFLQPVLSFYCLHEHIRERAPPVLS